MKVALIIEKPEVGGVLPSLAAEGAAPDVALSQATFFTGSSSFPSARSQHCFHFKSCKIIPALHSAFQWEYSSESCVHLIENDKKKKKKNRNVCPAEKRRDVRTVWEKDEKQLYWQRSGCLCDPNSRAANQIALLRVIRLQWKLVSQLLGWVVLRLKTTQALPADNDCFSPDSE